MDLIFCFVFKKLWCCIGAFCLTCKVLSVFMTALMDSWGHLWYVRNWCGDALVSTAYILTSPK